MIDCTRGICRERRLRSHHELAGGFAREALATVRGVSPRGNKQYGAAGAHD
jgi:hypothetical protein